MKLALKILGGVALVVAILVGILLWNASQFGPKVDTQTASPFLSLPVDVATA
jgi:hypothetical protein